MKWISRSNYREFEKGVELEGGEGERRWKFSKFERISKFDRDLPDPLPLKRERKKKYTWNSENWKFSSENFHFFEEKGKNTKATIESVVVVSIRGIGTKQFCQGASRRNATEPDRGKWSRGGGGGGGRGGHYCVRVPCTTTLRAVHACNRFSFHASLPLSPPPSLVRPVKINKGTINKNYTFFIHLAREGARGLGLQPTIVATPFWSTSPPPTRAQPLPFPAFELSFFWKEKEKEKEGRGDEKEIFFDRSVDADRFRRGARILGINWSIFFFSFFFRAVEIRRDNRFLFFLGLRLFSFGSREIVRVANYRSTFRTEEDKFLITNLKNSILLFFPSSSECPIKFFPSTT